MHLEPGQFADMVDQAVMEDSAIICHSTLQRGDVDNAACRASAIGTAPNRSRSRSDSA